MSTNSIKASAGFTLMEVVVSILLISVITGALYSLFRVQTRLGKVQENRLEAQERARSILDLMARDIRNAAYNPLGATGGNNCGGGIAGAPAVVTAGAATFRFTLDFQGGAGTPPSADGHCDDPDEDITYSFDTTGCPTGSGSIARNGGVYAVIKCNVSLDFRYFKQDGTELSRPVGATDLASIQRVLITLTVQSKNPDPEFGGQLNATMTSNVDLRNRGLS